MPDQPTPETIPFGNGTLEAARDQFGEVLGVTVRCLVPVADFALMTPNVRQAAEAVVEEAGRQASRRVN